VAALGVLVEAQSARVRVVEPTTSSYLAGPSALKAIVEPAAEAGAVERVVFLVDGREVCRFEAPPFECSYDAGPDVVAHTVRVIALMKDGQRLARTVRTRGIGYADRVRVEAIQLAVVVTDGSGNFVRNLPRSAFTVYEDNRPQRVSVFASENIPLELVAALDMSQSMAEALEAMKVASRMFVSALPSGNQVSLVAFNDNIFPLVRRETSIEARTRAIDRLAPWGGTALYDVIIRSMDMLGTQPGRRALVLFSDGEDQSSIATLEAAIQRVEASDSTIYAVGLGQATRQAHLRQLLERIVRIGGGRGLFTDREDELKAAFAEIVEDLSNQYLVGYQPTNQRRDGKWRELRIEVDRPGLRVRHRQGFRLLAE
jgi:VWFA-related protein